MLTFHPHIYRPRPRIANASVSCPSWFFVCFPYSAQNSTYLETLFGPRNISQCQRTRKGGENCNAYFHGLTSAQPLPLDAAGLLGADTSLGAPYTEKVHRLTDCASPALLKGAHYPPRE